MLFIEPSFLHLNRFVFDPHKVGSEQMSLMHKRNGDMGYIYIKYSGACYEQEFENVVVGLDSLKNR